MSKIFFTSDLHFNHNKDFIWKARGYQSVEEMNEDFIKKWNSVVSNDDIVYVLGDVIMGEDLNAGLRMLLKLKGKKYLAIGNHDTDARIKAFKANHIFEDIQMGYRIKAKKKTIILTHYPTVTANGEDTRTLNFYGHTHQTYDFFENKVYMYHVGVDSHNGYPVLLEDALQNIHDKKYEIHEEERIMED